ncbi:MAG: amino acid adenylation domain-containing protein [Microcoleaceae cyanobacterium]
MQFKSKSNQKELWNAYRQILASSRKGPVLQKIERENTLPLSYAQQRFWLMNQFTPDSSVYNEYAALIRLEGVLNRAALQQSFNEILRRHEALRTNIVVVDEQPAQKIRPYTPLNITVVDLQGLDPQTQAANIQAAIAIAQQPFNLEQDLLVRIQLLCLGELEHLLMVTIHHLVYDGWSQGIFVKELSTLYNNFCNNQPSPLSPLAIQYADFAHWQRQWLQGETLQSQLDYWQKQLGGRLPILNLPTDRPRAPKQTYRGMRYHQALPKAVTEGMEALSQSENVTPFMTWLAAFKTLLYRYTQQEDVLVGSPIANRNKPEIAGLIGCFVNTIVLRSSLSGDWTFLELLTQVREVTLGAYAHQDLPFEKLVEQLHLERDLSISPLFQVMFAFQNTSIDPWNFQDLTVTELEVEHQSAKFDLTLYLESTPEGLVGVWEYNRDLFAAATIARMAQHFQTLLAAIVSDPHQPIATLPLLTSTEQQQLVRELNHTQIEYPKIESIPELFMAQVERTPDAIAVIFEDQQLTYRELNEYSNKLADELQQQGVKPEVLVGICVERSLLMVIGLLGILKAGGAYVPLDPAYPPSRLAFILEDAQISGLLTQEKLLEIIPENHAKTICLDQWYATLNSFQTSPELITNQQPKASNLAYIIYTSGSTGQPKGVSIEHHSAVTLIQWAKTVFTPEELAGVLASTSICFDLSVFELFVTLSWGGTVILAENALQLPSLKAANQVTLINTVPSAIAQLLKIEGIPTSVRTINLAGEALSNPLVQKLYQLPHLKKVFNLYGPSEDTTYSTFALIVKGAEGIPPIGCPISNTQCFVLDSHLQLVPKGVPGELYLGGEGLARGYLNRPDLTDSKFIANLFNDKTDRLYKTGDLARYLPNGELEYLGRIDNQVKIRGFRIELGEIEAALSKHPHIETAIVVVPEDNEDKRLVAYLVAHQQPAPTSRQLRTFLGNHVPEYMIPAYFVLLEALPLTPNGKVNRRALPAPEKNTLDPDNNWVAPRDYWEMQLIKIWQKILNTDSIGVKDDFFELGGHSLLAVSLMAEIKQQFGQTLPLTMLFQKNTIEQLATVLRHQQTDIPISPLVEFQPGSVGKSFFLIHPVGGSVLSYLNLANNLGSDIGIYGLQAQGLDGKKPPLTRIEDMATDYLKALRTVQPNGSYFLGGWSMGGVIALEMAIQLQQQGEKVALLALMDSWIPKPNIQDSKNYLNNTELLWQFTQDLGLRFGQKIVESFEVLQSIPADEQLNFILQQAQVKGLLAPDLDFMDFQPVVEVFKHNLQALQNYKPKTYSGKITFLKAKENLWENLSDSSLDWHQLSRQSLDIHPVDGNHYTMLSSPCVDQLSAQLRQCMTESL